MMSEGKIPEARAIAERLPTTTTYDRYRRASLLANIGLGDGLQADYSEARREASDIEPERRAAARESVAYNEMMAAIRAGRSLHDLPRPDTCDLQLGVRDSLWLWGLRLFPLLVFLGFFVSLYVIIGLVSVMTGGEWN